MIFEALHCVFIFAQHSGVFGNDEYRAVQSLPPPVINCHSSSGVSVA